MHPDVVAAVVAGVEQVGGTVEQDKTTEVLTINGEFTSSVVVVRCKESAAGSLRWHIRLDTGLMTDLTVAVRLDSNNKDPLDYYLLPALDMFLPKLRLAENNGISIDSYRFESLDAFFDLAARVKLSEVA